MAIPVMVVAPAGAPCVVESIDACHSVFMFAPFFEISIKRVHGVTHCSHEDYVMSYAIDGNVGQIERLCVNSAVDHLRKELAKLRRLRWKY